MPDHKTTLEAELPSKNLTGLAFTDIDSTAPASWEPIIPTMPIWRNIIFIPNPPLFIEEQEPKP